MPISLSTFVSSALAGAIGSTGPTGATGVTGASGVGATGAQGNNGASGSTGLTGATGITGASGISTPAGVSDQTNTSTGYFDLPSGTTEQRPETPSTGMARYNTTIGYMEVYNGISWSPIAGFSTITSISPTSYNGEQGTVITINGNSFYSGSTVKFISNSNVEYSAGIVTYINSGQLTATTPQDFTVAQEPMSIKVISPSGLSATLSDALDCGGVPTWTTASGTLATVDEGTAISTSVAATDPDSGGTIASYSISSGSLPAGVSLNASTGAITGTAGLVASDTTYTFSIIATDNAGNSSSRSFSIVVNNIPDPSLLLSSYNQSSTNITGSITIPARYTRLYLFGAGGGGGSGLLTSQDDGFGGGGAGAANISGNYISVSAGQVYNYQIGARGDANAGSGGTTSVTLNGGSAVMTLTGGAGSANSAGSNGGSGGTASGLAGGVNGGSGGKGGLRSGSAAAAGGAATNGCGGGGGGGAHLSNRTGGTGGTTTMSVGTFTKGSTVTISFAGVAGSTSGAFGAGAQLASNVLDSLGGGGNGQDANSGGGGGAGGGIQPTVNGVAYPRYYGGGGGGNRSFITGATTTDGGRNSGGGGGGFLIAVATVDI